MVKHNQHFIAYLEHLAASSKNPELSILDIAKIFDEIAKYAKVQ